jgi:hypothetical protein
MYVMPQRLCLLPTKETDAALIECADDGYGICQAPGTFCGGMPGVNKTEASWHREFYESKVYPHLLPHQRVAAVPGFFGW